MELILSLLMLTLPILSIFRVNIASPFVYLLIGAHPYATATAIMGALFFRADYVIRKNTPLFLVLLFFLYIGYSVILGMKFRNLTALSELIQALTSFGLVYFLYHYIDSYARFQRFLNHLIYSGLILASLEIAFQIFNIAIDTSAYLGSTAENYTAFYLVATTIAIPIVHAKTFVLKICCLGLGMFAIYINESRAMLLLSILLICFYIFFNSSQKVKYILAIVGIMFVIGVVSLFDTALINNPNSVFSVLNFENNFSNLERLGLLLYSYELFLNNPFGYGIGSSFSLFNDNPYTINEFYPHPHNTLAFLAVELGFVGIGIYILLIGGAIYTALKCKIRHLKLMSLNLSIVLFLGTVVEALFYNGLLMLSTFLFLALLLICRKFDIHV